MTFFFSCRRRFAESLSRSVRHRQRENATDSSDPIGFGVKFQRILLRNFERAR